MRSKITIVGMAIVATGCANNGTKPVGIADVPKPGSALVAVNIADNMYYRGHVVAAKSYTFELHKIDLKSHSIISKVKLDAPGEHEVQIFSIDPGCYFVGEASKWVEGTTSLFFASSAEQSTFCANAGSITYPGDWKLTMYQSDFRASGTVADGFYAFTWNYALTPIMNSSTLEQLRRKYPLLVSKYPIEISEPVHKK